MATQKSANSTQKRLLFIVTLALSVTALYVAQAILLPFALAVLLSFLLAPIVTRLEHAGLARPVAVVLVVGVTVLAVAGMAVVVGNQFIQMSTQLPRYKDNLILKVRAARGNAGARLGQARQALEEIGKELTEPEVESGDTPAADTPLPSDESIADAAYRAPIVMEPGGDPQTAASRTAADDAVAVKVVALPPSPLEQLRDWLGPLVAPLSNAGIVLVFVIFMLLKREDLRNRLLQLFGTDQLHVSTAAMDDAAARLSRFLRMQLFINFCYGTAVGVGLYVLGVPNAILWGALGVALRFLPYVGPWLVAFMPIALTLAISQDWSQPLLTIGLFVCLELIVNNILEPWLYGSSTGVSSVGIIISVIFWTWLWGPVGLVLAMPLTVCLVVLGKHVPPLKFLDTLLSEASTMPLPERVYQRLLALDYDEASELAASYVEQHSVHDLCDNVLTPVLCLVEQDRYLERIDENRLRSITESVESLMLEYREDLQGEKPNQELLVEVNEQPPVQLVAIPARTPSDAVVATMVVSQLHAHGFHYEIPSSNVLLGELLSRIKEEGADVVLISAVAPIGMRICRSVCKRVRAALPNVPIVVVLAGDIDTADTAQKLAAAGATHTALGIKQAVDYLRRQRVPLLRARAKAGPTAPSQVTV